MRNIDNVSMMSDRQIDKMLMHSSDENKCVLCHKNCDTSPVRQYCYSLTTIIPYACEKHDCTSFLQNAQAKIHTAVIPVKCYYFDILNNSQCYLRKNGRFTLDVLRFDTCDFDGITLYFFKEYQFMFSYIMLDKISDIKFSDELLLFDTSMYSNKQWNNIRKNVLLHELCSNQLFDKIFARN
jgi:hypothetical protein